MELTDSMLSFLTIVFATHLHLCQREIIYEVLMATDEILKVYRTDAAALLCTTPEQHILTLPPLPPTTNEHESRVKSIIVMTNITIMTVTTLGTFIYTYTKFRYDSSLMGVCFALYLVSRWL